jgi:hypothetical protein
VTDAWPDSEARLGRRRALALSLLCCNSVVDAERQTIFASGTRAQGAITMRHFGPTIVICAMKYFVASTLAVAIVAASTAAKAETSGGSNTPEPQCAIGYVTGVGGSAQSVREYLATLDRDKYRYLADNPIQCKVSDEGRASACTGLTYLRHERVSVYDDTDPATTAVVARVELDQGTYPVIIAVPKQVLTCEE